MRNNTHVFSYVQTYKTFLFLNRAEAWRRFMWQLFFFFFFFFILYFCLVDCQKKNIVKFFHWPCSKFMRPERCGAPRATDACERNEGYDLGARPGTDRARAAGVRTPKKAIF
jgi:hypothetical protein